MWGNHFTNVKDELLNILQLKQQQSYNPEFADLVTASIQQKSEEMKPVPFKAAIDLTKNRKYLRYALPPLLALGGILLVAPNIIRDSANRLYNNNKEFERPAPFHFSLRKQRFAHLAIQELFKLEVNVDGATLPQDVFIDLGVFSIN